MKKNLSKNAVKAMALGLAVTMGSSMAINGVYNNTVTVQAATDGIAKIENTDIANVTTADKHIITAEGLLFKVESASGDNLTVKLIGKGADADANQIDDANKTATGDNIPFKATEEDGKLVVKKQDNSDTKTISVIKIGDGQNPLKTYKIAHNVAPAEDAATAVTLTKTEFEGILNKGVTEISAKALNGIDITGAEDENNRISVPKSVETIGANAFGGSTAADKKVFLEFPSTDNFNKVDAVSFDKEGATATNDRTYNIKVKGNTEASSLRKILTGKNNVTIVENDPPKILTSGSEIPKFNKTEKTITLTADEDLQVFEKEDNGGFTITPALDVSNNPAITVTKVEVKNNAKNKIILTLQYTETEELKIDGNYKINYAKPANDSDVNLKDSAGNAMESTKDGDVTVSISTISPKLQSAIIKASSQAGKGELTLTFDKETKHTGGDLHSKFTIKKSDNNTISVENNNGISNGSTQNEIVLTLSEAPKFSESYTITYTGSDDNNNLSDAKNSDNKVEDFSDFVIINKAIPVINDEITAGDYKVKVTKAASAGTNGEVTLIGKIKAPTSKAKASDELSVLNGQIKFDDTTTFVINKVGDGTKAIDGDDFTVEELNNLLPEVTEIKSKAFENKTIENKNKLHLTLPKVNKIEANGFGVKSGLENVNLPSYNGQNVVDSAFKNSTDSDKVSITNVTVPKGQTGSLDKHGITAKEAVVAPSKDTQISVGALSVKVLKEDAYGSDGIQGTVLLEAIPGVKAADATAKIENGVVYYTKDEVTYEYKLTQIGEGQKLGSIDTATLMNNLQNVEEVKENAFENVTFASKELELPMATKIGANAFKGTTGLETVKLPMVEEVGADKLVEGTFGADGDTTSVKWVKVANAKYDTIKNSITNKKVKVIPMTDTTVTLTGDKVVGTVNTSITPKEITLTLKGYKEDFQAIDDEGMTFNNWITNLPAGLKVTKKEDVQNAIVVNDNAEGIETKTLKLEISGTPLQASTETIKMTIPSTNLKIGKSVKSTENADLKFEIAAAPSTGGGSSNSGTTGGSSSNNNGSGGVSIGNGVTTGGATTGNTNNNNNNTGNTNNNTGNVTEQPIKQLSIDTITLPAITETSASFTDIPSTHWASSSISKLSSAGIIKGLPDGGFNANGNSKRADVTIILTRLLGLSGASTTSNFTDVDPNAYYADAVNIAKEYGIITGSNGKFNPNSNISRQDTMVMISRILTNLGVSVNKDTAVLAQFADTANVSSYALEATAILVNAGVINGNGGKINPKAAITRAEMSVIIDRLYTIIEAGKKAAESTTTTTTTTTTEGSTETTTASKNASTETTTKTSESSTETTTQKTN